jgi:AcrR family transcriptional regulator
MRSQRRAEETRTRIMQAAEICFASQGYDAAGLAEICRQAGVSKGAFYHHFASKQDLFLALLNVWLERLDAQIETIRAESPDVVAAILRMVEVLGPILEERKGQLPIIFEFWIKAGRDPAIWQATIAPYRRYRDYFAAMIQSGVDRGTLHADDPELIAQMLVSLTVGLLLQGLLDADETDWGDVAQQSVRLLLRGLQEN